MNPTEFAKNYLTEAKPIFDVYTSPHFAQAMEAMYGAYQNNKQIFIFGNGGSAGTANHMVNDLAKGTAVENKKRLRVIGLADNMSLLTAIANDMGYENVFVEQLKNLMNPGDLCVAISASGNSPNVVKAVDYARSKEGFVIGLVGFTGGKVKQLSNLSLHFETHNYGICEDAQLMFSHLSSQWLCQKIKSS